MGPRNTARGAAHNLTTFCTAHAVYRRGGVPRCWRREGQCASVLGREVASRALEAREKAGIKIRQPLGLLKAKRVPETLRILVAEEVNVKDVVEDITIAGEVELDTTLTPELREEGALRGLIRRVQEWRKEQGLTISDRPSHTLVATGEEKMIAEKYKKEIMKEAGLSHLTISEE
jgi:hypothetical protein